MVTFPDPFDCESLHDYLGKLKGATQKEFSQRKLSRSLGWPVGLIPDILAGRKSLSLLRTLELANYAQHSVIETERLIAISCLQNIPERYRSSIVSPVSPKFRDKHKFRKHKVRFTKRKDLSKNLNKAEIPINEEDLFLHFAVFEIIKWKGGYVGVDAICTTLKDNFSPLQIEPILQSLLEQNAIAGSAATGYRALTEGLTRYTTSDQVPLREDIKLYREFFRNFLRFSESPHGQYIYLSSVAPLHPKHFKDYRERVMSVNNWLIEKSEEVDIKESSLFQVTMTMFPIAEHHERER